MGIKHVFKDVFLPNLNEIEIEMCRFSWAEERNYLCVLLQTLALEQYARSGSYHLFCYVFFRPRPRKMISHREAGGFSLRPTFPGTIFFYAVRGTNLPTSQNSATGIRAQSVGIFFVAIYDGKHRPFNGASGTEIYHTHVFATALFVDDRIGKAGYDRSKAKEQQRRNGRKRKQKTKSIRTHIHTHAILHSLLTVDMKLKMKTNSWPVNRS